MKKYLFYYFQAQFFYVPVVRRGDHSSPPSSTPKPSKAIASFFDSIDKMKKKYMPVLWIV